MTSDDLIADLRRRRRDALRKFSEQADRESQSLAREAKWASEFAESAEYPRGMIPTGIAELDFLISEIQSLTETLDWLTMAEEPEENEPVSVCEGRR